MRTYRDYAWLRSSFGAWLSNGYCVTLIEGITPDAVLDALAVSGARPTVTGFADIELELWDFEQDGVADGVVNQVVAVADMGHGWTVMIQQGFGGVGITETVMRPLTAAHQVVTHMSDIEAVSRFEWWKDGVRQIAFEPMFAHAELEASSPEATVAAIRSIIREVGGIDLDYDGENPRYEHRHVEGSFALAERLTGVALTHEFLEDQDFTVAVVPTTPEADRLNAAATEAIPAQPLSTTSAPTWPEALQLHAASKKLTIHGVMTATQPHQALRSLEFWFAPKQSWRFADDDGLVFIQNRRGDIYFRKDGVLKPRGNEGFGLDLHPSRLVDVAQNWDGTRGPVVGPDGGARGARTTVAGRAAWEFTLPSWTGHGSRIAFDAESGIAVRWDEGITYELVSFETGDPLDKAIFDGP